MNITNLNLTSSIITPNYGKLTVNGTGNTLLFNGSTIATGSPAANWSAYPATQTVDFALQDLSNVGDFSMPASLTNNFNVGGGTILTPVNQNNQFGLTTKIVNVSALTPMEITSLSGINLTANATTGTQEFNISLVGANGNDLNITAPDINLTMTDPGSFMNLTAPGGVAILGGGGFFMASGVFEVITGLDVSLITAGNIRIGSGNVLGATTQIEKFEFTDCNVEPMNGVNNLRLINCQISNVRRDAGGAGIFPGDFRVRCEQATTYTIQSYNSNAQQVIWQVQTDQGSNVYKSMNLTSLGSNQPIRFSMSANGNTFTTTYNSGNTVTYATTGGDALLAGVGTINASTQLSAPTVQGTNGNFVNLLMSTITTSSITTNTVSALRGDFKDLYVSSATIHLGANAGAIGQSSFTVAVGDGAGQTSQGVNAVAVGSDAGNSSQGANSVAVGEVAGFASQGINAVAVGANAGYLSQGPYSLAIGTGAGNTNLGSNSVAIGTSASANGFNFANTIAINATSSPLNPAQATSCYIAPIRAISSPTAYQAYPMMYNTTTGEVHQDTAFYGIKVVATSASAIALDPTLRGKIYILTGTTTQAFTTAALGVNDTNFFVTLKNGNAVNGGDITISGATNNTVIHEAKSAQNSGILILYWNGTALIGY